MRRIHSFIQNASSLQENKISIYELTSTFTVESVLDFPGQPAPDVLEAVENILIFAAQPDHSPYDAKTPQFITA